MKTIINNARDRAAYLLGWLRDWAIIAIFCIIALLILGMIFLAPIFLASLITLSVLMMTEQTSSVQLVIVLVYGAWCSCFGLVVRPIWRKIRQWWLRDWEMFLAMATSEDENYRVYRVL